MTFMDLKEYEQEKFGIADIIHQILKKLLA